MHFIVDKFRRFQAKSFEEKTASLQWHVRAFVRRQVVRVLFGLVSWGPRGPAPFYVAVYPSSLPSFAKKAKPLYPRWIRGNKLNNNGDGSRFIALALNVRHLMSENIPGDFAELGVWKGNSAALLADFAAEHGRKLYLFDTFEGFDARDFTGYDAKTSKCFEDTSIDYVRETIGPADSVTFVKGFFPESITPEAAQSRFALVHLDCDLYAPMKAALEFFYPLMPKGGMLILHDYSSGSWPGATQAINEFTRATGEHLVLWPDKSGTAVVRKSQ